MYPKAQRCRLAEGFLLFPLTSYCSCVMLTANGDPLDGDGTELPDDESVSPLVRIFNLGGDGCRSVGVATPCCGSFFMQSRLTHALGVRLADIFEVSEKFSRDFLAKKEAAFHPVSLKVTVSEAPLLKQNPE